MSKQFIWTNLVAAEWSQGWTGAWYIELQSTTLPEEAGGPFREWMDEGPPKPSYRITKIFDQKPAYVATEERGKEQGGYIFISDDELEEA